MAQGDRSGGTQRVRYLGVPERDGETARRRDGETEEEGECGTWRMV